LLLLFSNSRTSSIGGREEEEESMFIEGHDGLQIILVDMEKNYEEKVSIQTTLLQ
jgi:hypothetical protein